MIVALVLAAGRSERMGRPKALLPLRETTFLGAILRTIESSRVEEARVVLGEDAGEIRAACGLRDPIVVLNRDAGSPMIASVRCGLRALPLETKGVLLWPVDHPLVRAETVDLIVDAFEQRQPGIVLPVCGGKRGHPVLFSTRLVPELVAAPDTAGARHVVRAHEGELLEVPVEDVGVVTDIDTPETYEKVTGRKLFP